MFNKLIRENPIALRFASFQLTHQIAVGMIVPFFSLIFLEAGWSNKEITTFFAMLTLGIFLFAPIVGKISDRIGRKKIILFGVMAQVLFLLTYYNFTDNRMLVYLVRFIDGIGSGAVSIVALGAFEDMIKEKRGFWTGVYFSVSSIGAIIAPIIAGFIANWHLAKTIFLVAIVFLVLSIILLIFVPETKRKKTKIVARDFNPLSEIADFLKYKRLQGMALLGIGMNAKGQIFTIFFPIFAVKTLGLPTYWFGILWGINPLFHVFQFYFGRIADKVSAQFGVMFGVLIVCVSLAFMPYIHSIFGIAIMLVIYSIGSSIWNVTAWSMMSSVAEKNNMEGEVVGTYYSISYLGMFFASIFGAYIVDTIGISRTIQIFALIILGLNCVAYFFFKPIFHHTKNKSVFHKILSKN